MAKEPDGGELLARITHDPQRMGGRPCIRGLRVTVGTVVGFLAVVHSAEEILRILDEHAAALEKGAFLTVDLLGARVRYLPIERRVGPSSGGTHHFEEQ